MRICSCGQLLLLVGFAFASAPTITGSVITLPPGLHPGDRYRLVFISSTTRDASSGDIGDYNEFVSNAANSVPELALLNVTWKAIASTAAIDARDNIGNANVPIYRLDGSRVADSTDDIWDGALTNPVLLTELNTELSDPVAWTGTLPAGLRHPFFPMGASSVVAGVPTQQYRKWVFEHLADPTEAHSLYGMSSIVTVGGDVPEPTTVWLLFAGLVFCFFLHNHRAVKARR